MQSGRSLRRGLPARALALRCVRQSLLPLAPLLLGACGSGTGITVPLVVDPIPTASAATYRDPDRREAAGSLHGPLIDEAFDARLERLFSEARTLVESDSGTDLSGITLLITDDAVILDEVGVETRRLVYGRLGTGTLAERLLDALVDVQSGTYAALYSGRQRTVMVSREVLDAYLTSLPPVRSRRDGALLVLMLHELVHAADDLRHDIHANRTFDFRASFAQSAVFEGHAQWRTRDICRRHGCLDGLASLDAFMFGEDERGDASAESGDGGESVVTEPSRQSLPLDRNLLEYSYIEGERFVAALAARPDGAALIERLLTEPPRDPLQILDPASFPNEIRETRNRALLKASRGIQHPWLASAGTDAPADRGTRRIAIETSPLKGVNLRGDPDRRRAAVDGFTRLVTAMVAVQFHDPAARTLSPVEVTLMQTDSVSTARLFADTLHAHAFLPGTRTRRASADGRARIGEDRLSSTITPLQDGGSWYTAIATFGPFVVQASGRDVVPALMEDYVLGVLAALSGDAA